MLEGLEAMGNNISLSKSVIMGSTAGVRNILVNILSSAGWNLRQAQVCKDLGAGTSMALRRSATTRKERMQKASRRATHVSNMSKHNKQSRRLVRIGVLPQAAYGISNQSLTYKQRKALRNICLRASGVSIRSWCLTTAVRLLWNEDADPMVQQPLQLMRKWRTLLHQRPFFQEAAGTGLGEDSAEQVGQ